MSDRRCDRIWQVEAIRDGRLAATPAASEHVKRCTECRDEHERLEALATALRDSSRAPQDELRALRLRRRVVERANGESLRAETPRSSRPTWALAAGAVLVAALGIGWIAMRPAPTQEPRAVLRATEPVRFTRRFENHREVIALDDGALDVTVRPGPGDGVVVRVPDGVIEDRGTSFRVIVRAKRTVEVRVFEGSVAFLRTDGTSLLLGAGGLWRAPDTETEAVAPTSAPESTRDRAATEASLAEAPGRPVLSRTERLRPRAIASVDGASSAPSPSEDDLYLDVVMLLRQGRRPEARAAAARYLAAFPSGFRRAELEPIATPAGPENNRASE